jgi:hypothetical protein
MGCLVMIGFAAKPHIKVFAPLFSKSGWGMGQRPMFLRRAFFWKFETFFCDRKKGFKKLDK